jgi:hypothetical protein
MMHDSMRTRVMVTWQFVPDTVGSTELVYEPPPATLVG